EAPEFLLNLVGRLEVHGPLTYTPLLRSYLAWLDDTLGIRGTANQEFDRGSFDFRVVDSPGELDTLIRARNSANKSRTVAGYCWEDRKSTRLNSSHVKISYAVFCLNKKRH